MTVYPIELTEEISRFACSEADRQGFASVGEYLADVLRERMQAKRDKSLNELAAKQLLERLTEPDFESLRHRFHTRPETLSPEETHALFLHEIERGVRNANDGEMSHKSVLDIAEEVLVGE